MMPHLLIFQALENNLTKPIEHISETAEIARQKLEAEEA
jgi:hypothetical protein